MSAMGSAIWKALGLIASLDAQFLEIVVRSLQLSVSALLLSCIVALPLGAALALARFPGRGALVVVLNASMGLPPVVIGVVVYLLLIRTGPLGDLGWLFSMKAMVIVQFILVTPIVASLTRQTIEDLWEEYGELLTSLGASKRQSIPTLLHDGRHRLLTGVLAGFGRALGEVGGIVIVGGNIAHATRVMTTAIALETSKGDLELALALGMVLLLLAILVSAAASSLSRRMSEASG